MDHQSAAIQSKGTTTDLRSKATRGGGFSALAVAFEKSIAVLQLAIVARLLQPDDFGVFALGTAFLAGATTFTSLGIENVLVQRTEMTRGFVRSAWAISIIRGALISIVCFILASAYAELVSEPIVESVLRVLSLSPLLISLRSPNLTLAQRELQFRRLSVFQGFTALLQFGVSVGLAYQLRSVYALAIAQVMMASLRSALSWGWFGVPGSPWIDAIHLRELVHVGRHFLIIAVGTFVMTQADNFIVGASLGAAVLGFYALAYKASQFAVDVLNATVGRIVLSVFSRLQDQPQRLTSAFKEIWCLQVALLLPLVAAIALLADDVVMALYGDRYSAAADLLRILAVLTLGRGISHLLAPFMIGTGGVKFAARIKLFEASLFLVTVWGGTTWYGAAGAAYGAGATYLLSAAVRLAYVANYLELGLLWVVRSLAGASGAVAIASLVVLILEIHGTAFARLTVALFVFAGCYIISSVVMQREILPLLRKNLAAARGSKTV